MRAVRRRGTAPELALQDLLTAGGLKYKVNVRGLPGSPDIAFRKQKLAVFVHGCFWHRHKKCPRATTPKSNREFWKRKFAENEQRDAVNRTKLRALGWTVLEAWECQLKKNPEAVGKKVNRLLLRSDR
jgi:DNA mismatch endonuclease, patch repair protein